MRGALLLFSIAFSVPSFATVIIPNYTRNRPTVNVGPAIGWTIRNEAGLIYTQLESEKETNAVKADETELTTISPYAYLRVAQNLTIEGQYQRVDTDVKAPATAKDTSTLDFYSLGLGYELTQIPMEFGAQVFKYIYEEKDGATGLKTIDSDVQSSGIHAGYIVGSNLYIGAAFYHVQVDGISIDDTSEQFIVGMGQVFGERSNPSEAYEIFLNYENENSTHEYDLNLDGAINRGNIQYLGAIIYSKDDGRVEASGYDLTLGMDYLFTLGIFLGPEVSFAVSETKTGTQKHELASTDLALQAGYRSKQLELAATFTLFNSEDKRTAPTASKDEVEGQIIEAHASYYF